MCHLLFSDVAMIQELDWYQVKDHSSASKWNKEESSYESEWITEMLFAN